MKRGQIKQNTSVHTVCVLVFRRNRRPKNVRRAQKKRTKNSSSTQILVERSTCATLLYNFQVSIHHRWASTSILMLAISDIRHRHLLFQYRKKICRTENCHSDIGRIPISTLEFIPISEFKRNVTSYPHVCTRPMLLLVSALRPSYCVDLQIGGCRISNIG